MRKLELTNWLDWLTSKLQGSSSSALLVPGLQAHAATPGFSHGRWGSKFNKYLINQAILLAPRQPSENQEGPVSMHLLPHWSASI